MTLLALSELRPPGAAPPGLGALGTFLLALAGATALVDWAAVARGVKPLEYVAKPLTLGLLLAAAAALTPVDDVRRDYFAAALVLSLAGDVVLMLEGDLLLAGWGPSWSPTSTTSSAFTTTDPASVPSPSPCSASPSSPSRWGAASPSAWPPVGRASCACR